MLCTIYILHKYFYNGSSKYFLVGFLLINSKYIKLKIVCNIMYVTKILFSTINI